MSESQGTSSISKTASPNSSSSIDNAKPNLTSDEQKTLPSDQIRGLVQPPVKPEELTPAQFMAPLNPYFDYEERIDESERKIKFEAARYSKLVENKIYY